MKKVMKKFKQILSILLAAAMVITLVPETGMSVSAAELETVAEGAEDDVTIDETTVEGPIVDKSAIAEVEGSIADEPVSVSEENTQESEIPSESDEELSGEFDVPNEGDANVHNVDFVYDQEQVTIFDPGNGSTTANASYTFAATAKAGYAITSVKAYTDVSDTGTEITVTPATGDAAGKYTIAGDLITEDITVVVTSVVSYKVTITNRAAEGIITEIQYAIGDGEFADYTEAVNVPSGAAFRIKFTSAQYYTIVVRNGENHVMADTWEGNSVGYTVESITENTELTIDAARTAFNITPDISKMADNTTDEAKITYVDHCAGVREDGTASIEAGNDLLFTVDVIEALKNSKKIDSVKYVVNDKGQEISLQSDENGVYKIPKEEITFSITIKVTTAPYAEYTVDFDYDKEKIIAPVLNIDGTEAGKDENDKYQISETVEDASFDIKFHEGFDAYKVKEITKTYADGKTETVTEMNDDGTYVLGKLSGDVTVHIEIELDPKKANVLKFGVNGHRTSYTATVSGNDSNKKPTDVSGNVISTVAANSVIVEQGLEGTEYKAGGQLVTLSKGVALYITAADGYQIDKVELGGQEIKPEASKVGDSSYYNVVLGDAPSEKELKVTTSPKLAETAKTVMFANRSGKMTYKVTENDKVGKVQGTNNSYKIEAGAAYFKFTVNVTDAAYEPLVHLSGNEPYEGEKGTMQKGVTPYTFSIAANLLPDNAVIYIDEIVVKQQVAVDYNEKEVKVTARIGAKAVKEREFSEDGHFVYEVVSGQTLTVIATPLDNCRITGAATKIGDAESKSVKVSASGSEIEVKVTDNTTVTVTSKGLYKASLTGVGGTVSGNDIAPVKNVYTIDHDEQYTASVTVGVNTPVPINRVDAKIGNANVSGADLGRLVKINADDNTKVAITTNNMTAAEIAGKKITVNLYTNNKDGKEEKAATYTLKVLPVVTKVTVAGVKNNTISQTIDTVKDYKITLTPKTANMKAIQAKSSDETAVKAEVTKDGMLEITTSQTAKEKAAEVEIYAIDAEGQKAGESLAKINVNTTAQLSNSVKPAMKLKSSNDISLTLTVETPKAVTDPLTGGIFYKVKVTPQDAANAPQSIKDATAKPFYFLKEEGKTSQDVLVPVNTEALGKGQEWKFKVEVTLIQTTDKADVSDTDEKLVASGGKSAAAVTAANKPFATKNPYYETTLKLKKGTTTVYTTQKDVMIATPVFGKNTTYKDIVAVEDITGGITDDQKLSVRADNVNGVILASAVSDTPICSTALGKHTIEVTAAAADEMYAAKATIVINVVRGIESLQFSTYSSYIYKADKKAASVKITPFYNWGAKDKNLIPKVQKVKDWEIVPVKEDNTYLKSMVTVKNGTVSVNKNYIVSADVTENQFYVKAAAADFDGNTQTSKSHVITITSEAIEIGEVVLAKYDEENDNYKVVARNGSDVEAAEIKGARVWALKKGTPETDTFTKGDLAGLLFDFNYASSNKKAVTVDKEYGSIEVLKPADNVTLTLTAADGSKKKASIKFNVKYAEVYDLELFIYCEFYREASGIKWVSEKANVLGTKDRVFEGTTGSTFEVIVFQKKSENDYWSAITDYTDFKVTVTGAKRLSNSFNYPSDYFRPNPDQQFMFVATGEMATIKLDSKSLNIHKTYTLKNASLANASKAPKVSIPDAIANSNDEQILTGKITNTNEVDFTDKYIKIEPDVTALNEKNSAGYIKFDDRYLDEEASEFKSRGGWYDEYQKLNKDGTFSLYMRADNPLIAGNYKLKVSVGTVTDDGKFIPSTKTGNATLKVVAPKSVKGSFNPTLKYTISARDGGKAVLTGKGKNFENVKFSNLRSANVKGKKNKFTEYFTLKDNVLYLSDDLTAKQISEIKKEDLTGYIDYEADLGSDAYGNPVKAARTVKITITLKDTAVVKYAAGNVTFLSDAGGKTVSGNMASSVSGNTVKGNRSKITVTANKEEVKIAYAYTENADFEVECANGALLILPKKDKSLEVKTYKNVKIYVIPEGSCYESEFADKNTADWDENTRKKAFEDYGALVKTTVNVKHVTDSGAKTAIAKKDLTKTFTALQYDNVNGCYYVDVPYTQNIPSRISSIVPVETLYQDGLLNFEIRQDYIHIYIEQDQLAYNDSINKLKFGQKIKVEADINYVWENQKSDKVTFTLTMPKRYEKSYDDVVKEVKEKKDDIAARSVRSYTPNMVGNEAEKAIVKQMRNLVEAEILKLVPADSNTEVVIPEVDMQDSSIYTAPGNTSAGSLKITATLINTKTKSRESSEQIEFNLVIPSVR